MGGDRGLSATYRQCGLGSVDRRHGAHNPLDAILLQRLTHQYTGLLGSAPAHRNPRVGRCELKMRTRPDERNVMLLAQTLAQCESGWNSTQTRPHDDDMCHDH